LLINIIFALLLGLGLGALGIESMDFAGSMLFVAILGAVGLTFAAFTAIFCQLSANPRTAQSFSLLLLVITFLIRAAGDMQQNYLLSGFSPLGLASQAQPYIRNYIWPLSVLLLIAAFAAFAAFWLCSRRDLGAGLFSARPGKKDAPPYLKNPLGLAWRLLKTPFIAWAIIVVGLGASYGSVMGDVDSFIRSNDIIMQMTGGDPMGFMGFVILIMGITSAMPAMQFLLTARRQESGGLAENVLARSVSRHSQLGGYFTIALIAAILMPTLNAVGFWAGSYAVMDDPFAFTRILEACAVYIPAALLMLGVSTLLMGFLPKATSLSWVYLGYAFAILYIGSMLGLSDHWGKLTPFGHIPMLPNDQLTPAAITALIIITAISLIMVALGFIGYRKRDMTP
jgi:ABC-2 type transport system permease protein